MTDEVFSLLPCSVGSPEVIDEVPEWIRSYSSVFGRCFLVMNSFSLSPRNSVDDNVVTVSFDNEERRSHNSLIVSYVQRQMSS